MKLNDRSSDIEKVFLQTLRPLVSQDLISINIDRVKRFHNDVLRLYQQDINTISPQNEKEFVHGRPETESYQFALDFLRTLIFLVSNEKVDPSNGMFNEEELQKLKK